MTTGDATIKIIVVKIKTLRNFVPMWLITKLTSFGSLDAFAFARIGINACEKAPSPKSLLKKFGILKATKNASVKAFAPKNMAIIWSLTRPKILEIKVIAVKIPLDFKNDLDMNYSSEGPLIMPSFELLIHLIKVETSSLPFSFC